MKNTSNDDERRFAIRVPAELAEKVEKVAEREDRTFSATVRTAMREYVASRQGGRMTDYGKATGPELDLDDQVRLADQAAPLCRGGF